MATQTQTLRRPVINPERRHDYLYDTHYLVSSERDHARATFKAHTSTDRVKRVPIFKTMFSELRHHPRFQMRLDVTDPVPRFINRQWRGYQDQQREALIRYTRFNYDPSIQIPGVRYDNPQVSGVNRYKYFRRPIIPFLQQVPPEVLLATSRQDPLSGPELLMERPPTPLTRTVEVQTDYRDSEAQTDPYTPEYVVRPGEQPELLTLATLSYGRGLPAGLAEVEMIERARAKRAWEATLPPLNDTSQLEKRRRMMDEMETKEWALRELEIEKLQEARLEVLQKLLKQREENHQELNIKRLDRLWSKKQEEKETRVRHIRNEHIKAIRKLTRKRMAVEGKLERRDVVHDYSDYGSQAYAPKTRIGVFLDRGSEQFVVKSRYLSTYQGLLELEHSLPEFVVNPRVTAPKPKTVTKTGFVKRKFRQEQELAEIHQHIKTVQEFGEETAKPLRFLQKIEKPIPRPPTPSVDVPSQEEEERELAVIFLQQAIRGRAIQNMMFEGKEKRMELIRELRSTHALQDAEQSVKKQEKQATLALQRQRRLHEHKTLTKLMLKATLALQRQRRLHEHKESHIDEALSQMEGSSVGDMLDFLSKELIRLQEERRVHAFAMLAERQRRIREAEESGRRQVEERRRREEDEIFKQVVKVHQNTVDTYLEDVILGSVEETADVQARREVQDMAEKINDIAYDMEESRTDLESEEIVADLVHCFLLPEAQKETVREKIKRQQRKYLLAAHNEIHKDGEGIIQTFAKPDQQTAGQASEVDKPTSPTQEAQAPSIELPSSRRQSEEKPSSHPASVTQEERPSSEQKTSSRPGSATDQERPPSDPKGSRPGSGTQQERPPSSSSHPPSGQKSRQSSARSEKAPSRKSSTHSDKAPSRKSSTHSDKAPSRKSSRSSQKEATLDLSIEGKGQSPPGSKPSSRKSSATSVKGEEKTSSRRGSASSEKKDGGATPKDSGSRRPSASSSTTKDAEAKLSRHGSSSSLKKEGTETPKGSRPGSASSVKSGKTSPQEIKSGQTSPKEVKSGQSSPKDSSSRKQSTSSLKDGSGTPKESSSRPQSASSVKDGAGSPKPESGRGSAASQRDAKSPSNGGSRKGSGASVKSEQADDA